MKKVFCLFLALLLTFFMCPLAFAQSGAFLVLDGRTLQVLESDNGDQVLPMASTTKIMTALVVLESVPLADQVAITAESVGIEGSSLYIKAGEVYTVEQLLYGLMLRSANDCAVALAVYVSGSVDAFVDLMNQKAVDLGLTNTHFMNPNGLPADGHYTTAKELALIMVEAMKNPAFRQITGSKRYNLNGQTIVNHNKLLTLYGDCIGGKTGYTLQAGRCLVTVAQRTGVPLVCVTLGRRDDWNIHSNAYEKWFSKVEEVLLAEKGGLVVELPLAGGGTALAYNADRVTAQLIQYDGNCTTKLLTSHFIYGNKEINDVVGTVEFWAYDTKIGESPLLLSQPIECPVKKELFITRIFRFFRRIFLKKG